MFKFNIILKTASVLDEIEKLKENYKKEEIRRDAILLTSLKKKKTMHETPIIEFVVNYLNFVELLNLKLVCKYYSNTVHNLITKTSISIIESVKKSKPKINVYFESSHLIRQSNNFYTSQLLEEDVNNSVIKELNNNNKKELKMLNSLSKIKCEKCNCIGHSNYVIMYNCDKIYCPKYFRKIYITRSEVIKIFRIPISIISKLNHWEGINKSKYYYSKVYCSYISYMYYYNKKKHIYFNL